MNSFSLMLSLFTCLILASCQVKDSAPGGGLISGHLPTTNKFTLQSPSARTYVEGEIITLNVSFPFDIIIDTTLGTPRLRMTIGATTRYADYVAVTNPKLLSFTYTVVAGETDANGIDVIALELNGSTLKFDQSGVITDCNVASITTTNLSTQKVDTMGATITDFDLVSLPGLYNVGETINFTMNFSEAVYVTGTPSFSVVFGGGTPEEVTYLSGSGTSVLTFSYTVTSSNSDTNGFDSFSSTTLSLNAGTIEDAVGNSASLDFSAYSGAVLTYSSAVKIVGDYPFVVDVAVPANGTYIAGQTLNFIVEFDRPVNVPMGVPYLGVTIGSTLRQVSYASGAGTNFLTFSYTAVPGDVDADGITVATSITSNGGNIRDPSPPTTSYFVDALNNVFSVPDTSGIILNALQPQAITVTRNTDVTNGSWGTLIDNKWNIGQVLDITVGFNTPVFVTQTIGTPSIPLTIGSTTVQAPYVSGHGQSSLIFRYTILEGDLDQDGTIALGNINLNSGVIVDAAGTNILLTLPSAGLTTTQIDGVRPTIDTITPPDNNTYSVDGSINYLDMLFTVNWSEPVRYMSAAAYLSMDVGGASTPLQYTSGTNTAAVVHMPGGALTGLNDSDGVTLSSPLYGTAVIKDQAGNVATDFTFTPPITTGILVDTTPPQVLSVDPAIADNTYVEGQDLKFTVVFDESVTIFRAGGYPRIPITIGASTEYLIPTSDSTGTIHTFSYTVKPDDLDTDGVTVGTAVESDGINAYARDAGENIVTGTFVPASTANIKVDATAPTVISAVPSLAKSYVSTETIQITVTFSEAVDIDLTGTPYIVVDFDNGTDHLDYLSGTGTDTIIFSRELDGNHFDMTGLPAVVNTINFNGGNITDDAGNVAEGNGTEVVFPSDVDLSAHFVTYPQVKLWVKTNFVNLAPPTGSASIANEGVVGTEGCGSGTCRKFDGTDALKLTANMDFISSVFMVFKTPVAIVNHDIFSTDIKLVADGAIYDMDSFSATFNLDGVVLGSNVNHNTNLANSTTHIIQVDFASTQDYTSGTYLLPTTFDGAVGDIIAVETGLTPTQEGNLLSYLNSQF